MKPFIKYAGGKAQSLQHIYPLIPQFNTYFEPFVGGGSLFFFVMPKSAVLSDTNKELIKTYQVCKDDVQGLIDLLKTYPNDKDFYLKIREKSPEILSDVECAARFIYLNKTCYNGLYRVNSKGEFNVPFGNQKNPKICDEPVLKMASKCLQSAVLHNSDFSSIFELMKSGDFAYLDPPYVPVKKDSFTSYSEEKFTMSCQERLAEGFKGLVEKGVKALLSNSDTEWVRDTYKDFEIIEISAKRYINSKGSGRGDVKELIVKGY